MSALSTVVVAALTLAALPAAAQPGPDAPRAVSTTPSSPGLSAGSTKVQLVELPWRPGPLPPGAHVESHWNSPLTTAAGIVLGAGLLLGSLEVLVEGGRMMGGVFLVWWDLVSKPNAINQFFGIIGAPFFLVAEVATFALAALFLIPGVNAAGNWAIINDGHSVFGLPPSASVPVGVGLGVIQGVGLVLGAVAWGTSTKVIMAPPTEAKGALVTGWMVLPSAPGAPLGVSIAGRM